MNKTNFEVYQRLLRVFLLANDEERAKIESASGWADTMKRHPNDSTVERCFQDSLDQMKLSIENRQTARENLDKFIRENLR